MYICLDPIDAGYQAGRRRRDELHLGQVYIYIYIISIHLFTYICLVLTHDRDLVYLYLFLYKGIKLVDVTEMNYTSARFIYTYIILCISV